MRSSSLLGILVELLAVLEEEGAQPADVRLSKFYRQRRYLGSRDRRFVGDAAYAFLRYRTRAETRWRRWKERLGQAPAEEGRTERLGALLVLGAEGLFPWPLADLLEASGGLAAAAGGGWAEVMSRIRDNDFVSPLDWPDDPQARFAAEHSLPEWIATRLIEERGLEEAKRLSAALLEPAPLDLRITESKVDRATVRFELEKTFAARVSFTPLSPVGLRIEGRVNLRQFLSRHPGWAEVQDEGSQLAAFAAELAPGQTLIDACAGGGGKLLAIADRVRNDGRFHACDIDAPKLGEVARRAELHDLRRLTLHQITPSGKLPPTLPSRADVVLVDAPCSGLGSLRRNPDLKYRYDPEAVSEFAVRQLDILRRFSARVRPGGRLVYVTCSILAEENEKVAERFLERHADFEPAVPETTLALLPPQARVGPWFRLDPACTGTDGFFIAVFDRQRNGSAPAAATKSDANLSTPPHC